MSWCPVCFGKKTYVRKRQFLFWKWDETLVCDFCHIWVIGESDQSVVEMIRAAYATGDVIYGNVDDEGNLTMASSTGHSPFCSKNIGPVDECHICKGASHGSKGN